MKRTQLCLLLATAVFATGCPKYKPSLSFDNSKNLATQINTHFTDKQKEYFTALCGSDDATAKKKRNELIEDALPYIDVAYEDFITSLATGRDRINFIADVVELSTSAAVGITKGERPIQILGIVLTAFRGGRRSADLNFYKDQTTPILINKMDGNRARVLATILTREKDSVDAYPIGTAISDIVAYYNAGTLVRAFTELQKDTADQTKQLENNLQVLKGVSITPEATPEFRNLSVAASQVLLSLMNDLNDADPKKTEAATKRVQKIVAALEQDKDTAAVLKAADASSQETDGHKLRTALIKIRASAAQANNNDLLNKINQAIVDNGK